MVVVKLMLVGVFSRPTSRPSFGDLWVSGLRSRAHHDHLARRRGAVVTPYQHRFTRFRFHKLILLPLNFSSPSHFLHNLAV